MTNAQKPNKKARTKSNHKTTTKGKRGKSRNRHGKGKTLIKTQGKGKRK
jgi:hypothetical protein